MSDERKKRRLATRLIHPDRYAPTDFNALAMPTWRGSTVVFDKVENVSDINDHDQYRYGLYGTPTTRDLAIRIAAIRRLGLDYESIAAVNPRIVYVQASGFGPQGPDTDAGAFVDVLAAQERHRIAHEALELTGSMQTAAARRLRAGIGSSAEEIRAGVQADVAGVQREHTEHEIETARQALAAMWGGEQARFERAEGDLEKLPAVPSMEHLAQFVETSPDVARWQTELARSLAADVAVAATRKLIADGMSGAGHAALIDKAITDLPQRLH